jgi:hypothetical protein
VYNNAKDEISITVEVDGERENINLRLSGWWWVGEVFQFS